MKPTRRLLILAIMPLALSLSGCGTSNPPKEVLDEAVAKKHEDITHYEITNQYTRQVNDETFHVYEFAVNYVGRRVNNTGSWESDPNPRTANDTIGFVKRGNSWYWRDWE